MYITFVFYFGNASVLTFASLIGLQAQIFEIVHTLSINELNKLACTSSIAVAELTLQCDIVVFHRTTIESMLKQKQLRLDSFLDKIALVKIVTVGDQMAIFAD